MKSFYTLIIMALLLTTGCKTEKRELFIETAVGCDIDWPSDTCAHAYNIKMWIADVVAQHFETDETASFNSLVSVKDYFEQETNRLIQEYKSDLSDCPGDTAYFSDSIRIHKIYEGHSVLTYKVEELHSCGNTHSWRVTSFTSFDKATGKIVTFADIFRPESREGIIRAVLKEVDNRKGDDVPEEFRVSAYVDVDKLDFSSLDANGYPLVKSQGFEFHNPAIVADGVIFYFYPYELGSYADGEYEVKLPIYMLHVYGNKVFR